MNLPINHNHVTRDIRPYGQCPGCDHYWLAHAELACDICGNPQWTTDQLRIWEIGKFEEPELINASPLWGLCFTCADLVTAEEWPALVIWSVDSHQKRGQRSMLPLTWPALARQNAEKPRPSTPQDFGSTP